MTIPAEMQAAGYLLLDLIEQADAGIKVSGQLAALTEEQAKGTLAVAIGMLVGSYRDRADLVGKPVGYCLAVTRRMIGAAS